MTGPVLVAVDLPHANEQKSIIEMAARLASLDNLTLNLITVIPDYDMSYVGGFFKEDAIHRVLEETSNKLYALAAELLGADQKAHCIVSKGKACEEILLAAERIEASLIVIGAHEPDNKRYLLGRTAARVMRHAHCSVYVVRD